MLAAAAMSLWSVMAATAAVGVVIRDYAAPWSHASGGGRPVRAAPEGRANPRRLFSVRLGTPFPPPHEDVGAGARRA